MHLKVRLALTLAALLVATPAAIAQEEGVYVDPGAPSAKEYALPLESARRDLSGGGDAPVRQGARDSPMFGEGVSRETERSNGTPAARSAKLAPTDETTDSNDSTGGAVGGADDGGSAEGAAVDRSSDRGNDDGLDLSSTGALLAGGGLVLLLTVLGGFALRAVRGPDHPAAP